MNEIESDVAAIENRSREISNMADAILEQFRHIMGNSYRDKIYKDKTQDETVNADFIAEIMTLELYLVISFSSEFISKAIAHLPLKEGNDIIERTIAQLKEVIKKRRKFDKVACHNVLFEAKKQDDDPGILKV